MTQKNVLIIDDDNASAQMLSDFLSDHDFDVTLAGTAGEGENKIVDRRPDLIIVDLYLPDMMGSDFCARLRNNSTTQNIPVILCTAHRIAHEEKMKGFKAGVDDFLVRPFELSELLARCQAVLRRTTHLPKSDTLAGIQSLLSSVPKLETASTLPTLADVLAPLTSSSPRAVEAATPSAIPDFNARQPADAVEKAPTLRALLGRVRDLLLDPHAAMTALSDASDFPLAWMLVLSTPLLASVGRWMAPDGNFNAWIGQASLGLVAHLAMWVATAGILHLAVPFIGGDAPLREALTVSGLAFAPRLVGAGLCVIYALIGGGVTGSDGVFSAGIDLIPFLPPSSALTFFGHISVFDAWAAWLVLEWIWQRGWMPVVNKKIQRWNAVTVGVGVACLLLGLLNDF